uniref:Thioredox_DsbH domain-containing protein n=1 Tax=Globodera pallida TaxID=36090 RepID=A0A183CCC1_GLOPA
MNRPIFLSVGYSTCHWCHVMEHESFEDESIGRLLNENFVSIKSLTGGGGWPMSVFLTPDLEPITGGTYFPPQDSMGRLGFSTILHMISDKWRNNQQQVKEQGRELAEAIRESVQHAKSSQLPMADTAVEVCYARLSRQFDKENGGFGSAPKFPKAVDLDFLLYFSIVKKPSEEATMALEMLRVTFEKLFAGGIHDHGFHRYSVDSVWHVPHFEKMLYDQGQLLRSYANFYKVTGEAVAAEAVCDIADYIASNLTHPLGGLFCAEDADSLPTAESAKKREAFSGRDDKILTAWNALAISGFCAAAQAIPYRAADFKERAEKAVAFIRCHLMFEGELLRSAYVDNVGQIVQILYSLNFDESLVEWAQQLQLKMDELFWDDASNSGYFMSRAGDPSIIVRMQDEQDGAEPCTNSVAASNLICLGFLLDSADFRQRANDCFAGSSQRIDRYPYIMPRMLIALHSAAHPPFQIIVVGQSTDEMTQKMLKAIHSKFLPMGTLIFIDKDRSDQWLYRHNSHLADYACVYTPGQPSVFMCREMSCEMPIMTLEELQKPLYIASPRSPRVWPPKRPARPSNNGAAKSVRFFKELHKMLIGAFTDAQSQILSNLFTNYDPNQRPPVRELADHPSIIVTTSLVLNRVIWHTHSAEVDLNLHQDWEDSRLAFDVDPREDVHEVLLPTNVVVWRPNTFFVGAQEQAPSLGTRAVQVGRTVIEQSGFMRSDERHKKRGGKKKLSFCRRTLRINFQSDGAFPVRDKRNIRLAISSASYPIEDVVYLWANSPPLIQPIQVADNLYEGSDAQYVFEEAEAGDCPFLGNLTANSFSCIELIVRFRADVGRGFLGSLVPGSLLVLLVPFLGAQFVVRSSHFERCYSTFGFCLLVVAVAHRILCASHLVSVVHCVHSAVTGGVLSRHSPLHDRHNGDTAGIVAALFKTPEPVGTAKQSAS